MIEHEPPATDLDRALLDPAFVFKRPADVLGDPQLQERHKVEILCRWAYDATVLAVAEEEGMSGGEVSDLGTVIRALLTITGGFDVEHTGPTKHAGFCLASGRKTDKSTAVREVRDHLARQ